MKEDRRIGIDLDGVLANWLAAAFTKMYFDHGIDLLPHVATWHPVDPKVNGLFGELIRNVDVYRTLMPIPGAVDGVYALLKHFGRVVLVTHRPSNTHVTTLDWLEKWGFPHLELYHSNGPKLKRARGLKLTHFVDDNPDTVQDMRVSGIAGYLLVVHEIPSQRFQRARGLPWIVPSWEKLLPLLVS